MRKLVSLHALAVVVIFLSLQTRAQQPQTQTATSSTNAQWANGVAPGYWPTNGTGLTLNVGAGSAICTGAVKQYSAGTLIMTANTTNYVYLSVPANCAPTVSTIPFVAGELPIAVVVTSGSAITSITDVRTWFETGINWPEYADLYNTGTWNGSSGTALNGIATYVASGVGGTSYSGGSGITFKVKQNYGFFTGLSGQSSSAWEEPSGYSFPICFGGLISDGDYCGFAGWPINAHFHDERDGTLIEAFNDPVYRFGGEGANFPMGYPTYPAADAGIGIIDIFDYDISYGGGYQDPMEVLVHNFAGGSNQNTGSGQGKVNSTGLVVKGVQFDQKQHEIAEFDNFCYGLGDCTGNPLHIIYSSGLSTNSDEGIHSGDSYINEDENVFSGPCVGPGCTTGSTKLLVCAGYSNTNPGFACIYPSGWSSTTNYVSGNEVVYGVDYISTGTNYGGIVSTAYSISSNVITFTASNSYTSGTVVKLSGYPASTFLNGQNVTVLVSGLTGSQFKANFTHANTSGTVNEAGILGNWVRAASGAGFGNQGDGRLLLDISRASAGNLGTLVGNGLTAYGTGQITNFGNSSGPVPGTYTAPSGTFTPSTALGFLNAAITSPSGYITPSQASPLNWSATTSYVAGNVVSYSGTNYIATGSNYGPSQAPTVGGSWTTVLVGAIPVTFTVNTITGTNGTGFSATAGSTVCIADSGATGTQEQAAVTAVGTLSGATQTITALPLKNHVAGALVAQGGTCGEAMLLNADTHVQNGVTYHDAYPLVGSPSSSLTYQFGPGIGGSGGSPRNSSWVYYTSTATVTYSGSTAILACNGCNFSTGGPTGYAVLGNISGLPISVSGATGGYSPYNVSTATATVTGSTAVTYQITGTPTDNTPQTVTFTFCQCTFTMYPFAEVLNVYNQSAKLVDGTVGLAANTVAWTPGDLLEEPHWYLPSVSDTHNNIGPVTPMANIPWGRGWYYSGNFVSGQLHGIEIDNDASYTTYLGHGGLLTAPQTWEFTSGIWAQDFIILSAPEQAVINLGCKAPSPAGNDGCTKWDASYTLFSNSYNSGGGVSYFNYHPENQNYEFQVTGASNYNGHTVIGGNVTGPGSGTFGLSVSSAGGVGGVGIWTDGIAVGYDYAGALLTSETGTGTAIVTNTAPSISGATLNGTTTVPSGQTLTVGGNLNVTGTCLGCNGVGSSTNGQILFNSGGVVAGVSTTGIPGNSVVLSDSPTIVNGMTLTGTTNINNTAVAIATNIGNGTVPSPTTIQGQVNIATSGVYSYYSLGSTTSGADSIAGASLSIQGGNIGIGNSSGSVQIGGTSSGSFVNFNGGICFGCSYVASGIQNLYQWVDQYAALATSNTYGSTNYSPKLFEIMSNYSAGSSGSCQLSHQLQGVNGSPNATYVWGTNYCYGGGNIGMSFIGLTGGVQLPVTTVYHLLSAADGTPTIAAGTGAGTSPTVSVTPATDLDGIINVTTGTIPISSATIATISFGTAFPTAPICQVQAANATAMGSGANTAYVPFASVTTSAFPISAGTTALLASTPYVWSYHCQK